MVHRRNAILFWYTEDHKRNLYMGTDSLLGRETAKPWDAFAEYAGDFSTRRFVAVGYSFRIDRFVGPIESRNYIRPIIASIARARAGQVPWWVSKLLYAVTAECSRGSIPSLVYPKFRASIGPGRDG